MKPGALLSRRIIVRAALLLLVGAIINVAVAWACMFYWHDEPPISLEPATASHIRWWRANRPDWVVDDPNEFLRHSGVGSQLDVILDGFPLETYQSAERVRAGLPFASLSYDWWRDSTSLFDSPSAMRREKRLGVWELKIGRTLGSRMGSVLPLRPIWPGFLINSIFYAMLVWGLTASPRALRTRRRLKRRLCPACAYPIGTSPVCTECGAPCRFAPAGRSNVATGERCEASRNPWKRGPSRTRPGGAKEAHGG